VADRSILNIRVLSDADDVHIASDNAVEPDAGVVADFHIPNNLSAFGDVNPFSQLRPFSLVLMQHRQSPDKTSKLAEFRNFTQ
jgi:hypothetical protein